MNRPHLLACVGILLLAADTHAAGVWRNVGSNGQYVSAFGVAPSSPQTFYATTFNGGVGGVFRTSDGGINWFQVSSPPAPAIYNTEFSPLAVDPVSPSTVFVGSTTSFFTVRGSGFFKSTDGGESWHDVSCSCGFVRAIAISPQDHTKIYAATENGISRSVDGGGTWTSVLEAFGSHMSILVIDPMVSSTIYSTGPGHPLWKSSDEGQSWSILPLPFDSTSSSISSLAIDPTGHLNIYLAGTVSQPFPNLPVTVLLKSSDGGLTWRQLRQPEPVVSLAVAPGPILFANTSTHRIYRTEDDGLSWELVSDSLPPTYGITLSIGPPLSLFALTGTRGVFQLLLSGPRSPRDLPFRPIR